jgi:protein tyrosine phosphatase
VSVDVKYGCAYLSLTFKELTHFRTSSITYVIWHCLFSVYFYNFGWKDYGEATLTSLLDMVKVMAFALTEGKVAVHCHAGELAQELSRFFSTACIVFL